MFVVFKSQNVSRDFHYIEDIEDVKQLDNKTLTWQVEPMNIIKLVCQIETTNESQILVPLSIFHQRNEERAKKIERNAICSVQTLKKLNLQLSSILSTSFPRLLEKIVPLTNWNELDVSPFFQRLLIFTGLTIITAIKTIERLAHSTLNLDNIREIIFSKSKTLELDCFIQPMISNQCSQKDFDKLHKNFGEIVDYVFDFARTVLSSDIISSMARYGLDVLFSAYGTFDLHHVFINSPPNLLRSIINKCINQLNYVFMGNMSMLAVYLQEWNQIHHTQTKDQFLETIWGLSLFSESTPLTFTCHLCKQMSPFSSSLYLSSSDSHVHCAECSQQKNLSEQLQDIKSQYEHLKKLYRQLLLENGQQKKNMKESDAKLTATEIALDEAVKVNTLLINENTEKNKELEKLKKQYKKQQQPKREDALYINEMMSKLRKENEQLKKMNARDVFCISSYSLIS